jgi:anti-sigma regulatory factor (Ser/Thr protein kinase)
MSTRSWTAAWSDAVWRSGSGRALSTPVILGYAVLALIGGSLLDLRFTDGALQNLVVAELLAVIAVVAFFVAMRATLLPIGERPSRPGVAWLVFLLAGVVRFAVLNLVSGTFGYTMLWSRLPGIVVVSLGACSLLAILESRRYEHAATLQRLARVIQAELVTVSRYEADVESSRLAIEGEVERELNPTLALIQERLARPDSPAVAEDDGETAALIRGALADLVRPLSHRLHDLAGAEEALELPKTERRTWSALQVSAPEMIRPGPIGLVLLLLVVRPVTLLGLDPAALSIALSIALVWLLLHAARDLWPSRFRSLTLWPALLALVVLYVAVFSASRLVVTIAQRLLGDSGSTDGAFVLIVFVGFGVALASAVTLLVVVSRRQEQAEESLRHLSESIELLTARKRKELWINRRNLSWVLHGPVQSAMLSAAIALSQADLSDAQRRAIGTRIREAADNLTATPERRANLQLALAELSTVWSDSCAIHVTISDDIAALLNEDSSTATSVSEITREAVSNAVRHGHATAINIEIGPKFAGRLHLTVSDNGEGLGPDPTPGLGSAILDELAMAWSRSSPGTGTLLKADIALG